MKKYRAFYAIGIGALIIVDVLEIFPPLLLKRGVDSLREGSFESSKMLLLAVAYVGVALLQGWMRYLWRKYIVRTSMMAADDMRRQFFHHLSLLAPKFFKQKRVGELVSLTTNDIQNVRFALGPTLLVLGDALFYFFSIVPVMIYLSPKLTLLSMVPMIFVTPFVLKLEKMIQDHFTNVQEKFSILAAESQESLAGVRVIKGAALEPLKDRVFARLGEDYMKANIDASVSQTVLDVGLDFFVSAAITLLFVVGGAYVIGEQISIGTFVAFHLYIQKMTWPMEGIALAVTYIQKAIASQKRLDDVYAEKNLILLKSNPSSQLKLGNNIPRIEVRNLTFSYEDSSQPILSNISFTVEPGERVGIVGNIGAGKSTLLHCLARLEPVDRGIVFFDGIDINDLTVDEVRRCIGLVPQESFLFSESILDNVLYGSEYFAEAQEIKKDHAEAMVKETHIYEETKKFPDQLNTILGERGLNISGGQKQRVAIARALARKPKVLIFDDCLSAVDSITETKLTNSFHAYTNNRSFLFASHRISSLLKMDKIIVLEQGRVVEQGPISELIGKKNIFYSRLLQQNIEIHHYAELKNTTEATTNVF